MVKNRRTKSPSNKLQLDRMGAPNHNVPLSSFSNNERAYHGTSMLAKADPECGVSIGLAFVDDNYNCKSWPERQWNNCGVIVPTYIDSEILAAMCLADDNVLNIIAEYISKNDAKGYKELSKEIERVFAKEYVPYATNKINEVAPILAEWLVAHIYQEIGER